MNVLFVCSGNICRSPMVEALFRDRIERSELSGIQASSAGTLGIEAAPASPEAVAALGEIGLDLSGHRSRGLREEDLGAADLVLVMEQTHLDLLARRFPDRVASCYLLRAFEHEPHPEQAVPDLPDPIGRAIGVYRDVLRVVEPCVEHLVEFVGRPE